MLVEHLPKSIAAKLAEKPPVKVFIHMGRCRIILRNDICSATGICHGDTISFLYDSENPYCWTIKKAINHGYRISDYNKNYLGINLKLPTEAIRITEGRKVFSPNFKRIRMKEFSVIELDTGDFLP